MDAGKMENIINAITTAKKLGIINMPQEESHDIAVSENTEQDNSSFGEGIERLRRRYLSEQGIPKAFVPCR